MHSVPFDYHLPFKRFEFFLENRKSGRLTPFHVINPLLYQTFLFYFSMRPEYHCLRYLCLMASILSLWFGFSILSFVDFIQIIFNKLIVQYNNCSFLTVNTMVFVSSINRTKHARFKQHMPSVFWLLTFRSKIDFIIILTIIWILGKNRIKSKSHLAHCWYWIDWINWRFLFVDFSIAFVLIQLPY